MFSAYEFTFAGISSAMFGLMIYDFGGTSQNDVAFGNKANIVETRLNNKITPIHYGVTYNKSPLEFRLVFGSERTLDRYELEQISLWLCGYTNYQWMTIGQSDLDRVQYHCLITELKPITHGWLPVAFEATVVCDCPYAYSYPFEFTYNINGTKNILFRNECSIRDYFKPQLRITAASGCTSFDIRNSSDNDRALTFTGLPAAEITIDIDNENGIITESTGTYNLYDKCNLNFFRMVHGNNNLIVTGTGSITISGRFLYNVAG